MSDPGLLPAPLAEAARAMAWRIAERVTDERLVADAVAGSAERARYPFLWNATSLYGGPPSLAVLFEYAARAHPERADRWRALAAARLREASGHTRSAPLGDTSLCNGLAGLASAIAWCAEGRPAFQPSLRAVRSGLVEQVLRMPPLSGEDGSAPGAYDVIQGAAGVLGHLVTVPHPGPRHRDAVHRLVDGLVELCTPPSEGSVHRRWRVHPRAFANDDDIEAYPHGYVSLGLSHGIPGPMAALAHAHAAGYRRPGITEALRHTADRVVALSEHDDWGRNWARVVPLDADCRPEPRPDELGRAAWCYGAPGVGSALLDAADALGDPRLRAVACEGLDAELDRVRDGRERFLVPSLCHGTAGVLAIAHKFAEDEPERYRKPVVELTERVLDACDPELPVFVQQVHRGAAHILLDSPGLLDGAAGVALTLWTVAGAVDARWLRALLIR